MLTLFKNPHDEYRFLGRPMRPIDGLVAVQPARVPPGGFRHRESVWDADSCCQVRVRFNLKAVLEMEKAPLGLVRAMELWFSSLGFLRGSLVLCIDVTPGKVEWHLIARNAEDAVDAAKSFESAIPGGLADPPQPLSQNPLTKRIAEITASKSLQKAYGLWRGDWFLPGPIYDPVQPPAFPSATYYPQFFFASLARMLKDGDVASGFVAFLPAEEAYFNIMRDLAAADQGIERSRLRTANPDARGLDINDFWRKLKDPKPLFCAQVSAAVVAHIDRMPPLRQQLSGFLSEYRHATSPLIKKEWQDYRRAGVSNRALRDGLAYRGCHCPPGICTSFELAMMFPVPNSRMLLSDVYVPMVRAGPPVSSQGSVIGVDPDKPDRTYHIQVAGGAHTIFAGNTGVGKTAGMLGFAGSLLAQKQKTGGAFILPLTSSNVKVACIPEDRDPDIVNLDPYAEHPVGVQVLTPQSIDNLWDQIATHAVHHSSSPVVGHIAELVFKSLAKLVTGPPFFGGSLEHVRRAAVDPDYRENLVERCEDARVKDFFRTTHRHLVKRGRDPAHTLDSLLQLFCQGPAANLFCQKVSKWSFEEAMVKEAIVLLDCHQNRAGRSVTFGLASLVSMLAVMACMVEANTQAEPNSRILLMDECKEYLNQLTVDGILQARQYGLLMMLGFQSLGSFSKPLRDQMVAAPQAVVYQTSAEDARYWSQELQIPQQFILSLPRFHFYLRQGSTTVHLSTQRPPPPASDERVERIRHATAERYGGEKPVFDDAYYRIWDTAGSPSRKKDITI